MRLSPGEAVSLVNISASGVLVEGKTRFVPGTRVTVHFEGTIKPNQIKARVVRCQVSAIGGGGSLQYQSAIAFEGRMDLPVEESALPAVGGRGPAPVEERPAPKKGKAASGSAATGACAAQGLQPLVAAQIECRRPRRRSADCSARSTSQSPRPGSPLKPVRLRVRLKTPRASESSAPSSARRVPTARRC